MGILEEIELLVQPLPNTKISPATASLTLTFGVSFLSLVFGNSLLTLGVYLFSVSSVRKWGNHGDSPAADLFLLFGDMNCFLIAHKGKMIRWQKNGVLLLGSVVQLFWLN